MVQAVGNGTDINDNLGSVFGFEGSNTVGKSVQNISEFGKKGIGNK